MCLILFAYRAHPEYKLIVAANRDEFYDRPTRPLHYWEDQPHILAGRDLSKMGTWMGVTKNGRFAALTNYRNPNGETAGTRSRGELTADFLKGDESPEQYLQKIAQKRHLYPGYNLLAGDKTDLFYYSNVEDRLRKLEPGIYGLSNHLLNTDWPKVRKGKEELSALVRKNEGDLGEKLFTLLQNADPAPDDILPKTGVTLEWERILSPIFIQTEGYGTRSSSVLFISEKGIKYRERVYSKRGRDEQQFYIPL